MWSTRRQPPERDMPPLQTAVWRERVPWLPIPALEPEPEPEPEPESVQVSVLARAASAQAQEGVPGSGLADWVSSEKRSCLRLSMLHFRMKTT